MPTPRNHATAGLGNGKMYVIGGRVVRQALPGQQHRRRRGIRSGNRRWGGVRAQMPTPRSAMAAGVHHGRIYVSGGEYQDSHMMATFRALEAYDPARKTWTCCPRCPRRGTG